MKCSPGISNFLEEISSLSCSVVFLCFFALITEEAFLISPCYSLEFCTQMGISFLLSFAFRSDQISHSVVSDSFRPHEIAACQASLSITNSWSSLRLKSIESVMPSSHLILCRPLLLLPPIPPSNRVFSNQSTLHMKWPKYWSFSFSIIPSK